MSDWVQVETYPANDWFALVRGPHDHKQHQNQQAGLDVYVQLIRLINGEWCHKKLYEASDGRRYFKHTGHPRMFVDEMTKAVQVAEYQVRFME